MMCVSQSNAVVGHLLRCASSSCTVSITPKNTALSCSLNPSTVVTSLDFRGAIPTMIGRLSACMRPSVSAVQTIVATWDAYKECKVCRWSDGALPSKGVSCMDAGGAGRDDFPGSGDAGGGRRGSARGIVAWIWMLMVYVDSVLHSVKTYQIAYFAELRHQYKDTICVVLNDHLRVYAAYLPSCL